MIKRAFLVRMKGLEPIRLTAPDPKSGLATNYNTSASQLQRTAKLNIYFLRTNNFSTLRHKNPQCRGLQAYIELFHSVEPVAVKMRRSL